MPHALQVSTPNDREIVITREFDAPRPLVWDAMSRPEFLNRWLQGPPGWEMTACEDDARPGGTFRWSWSGPDGATVTMTGVYREVVAPERCVRTEVFDTGTGPAMGEQLAALVLTDRGEKTGLTITLRYDSKEARDGAASSGMEKGMAIGYDRLEELLRSMK